MKIDANTLCRMNFVFADNAWRRRGENLTQRRARERRKGGVDSDDPINMEFDLDEFLDTDMGTETADATTTEGPSSTPPPSRRDSSIDQLISMMGNLQRDMQRNVGDLRDQMVRMEERQIRIEENQTTSNQNIQDLLQFLRG